MIQAFATLFFLLNAKFIYEAVIMSNVVNQQSHVVTTSLGYPTLILLSTSSVRITISPAYILHTPHFYCYLASYTAVLLLIVFPTCLFSTCLKPRCLNTNICGHISRLLQGWHKWNPRLQSNIWHILVVFTFSVRTNPCPRC